MDIYSKGERDRYSSKKKVVIDKPKNKKVVAPDNQQDLSWWCSNNKASWLVITAKPKRQFASRDLLCFGCY